MSPFLLFGLLAIAIPPIVHLLNRRRYVVVDWAAMQFLNVSRTTRQKVFFEHLLLMLLRMGLIAALVAAVASPVLDYLCVARLPGGQRFARLAGQTNRDVVLIVDGSYSMDLKEKDKTAHDAAREWTSALLTDLNAGDRVAILQAKQEPIPVLGALTADLNEVRGKLGTIPRPRGGVDWPKALQEAHRLLADSKSAQKEIIILTDGQRHGWADPRSQETWQLFAMSLPRDALPRVWIVNVAPDRPDEVPNWFITPNSADRSVATVGREVKFKFDVAARSGKRSDETQSPPEPPKKVLFQVDEQPAGEKTLSRSRQPLIDIDFRRSFGTTGSHLVSAVIDDDALPGDNRADFAIDVLPAIPVLVVDGDRPGLRQSRGSDYVRYAVAPAHHPQPSFLLHTISVQEFASQTLTQAVAEEPWTIPRLLVLQNVPELTEEQDRSIAEFLNRGGGVLVALGGRCKAAEYNARIFRDGEGWLPARLLAPAGDEGDIKKAAYPVAGSIEKTFLDLFKEDEPESF